MNLEDTYPSLALPEPSLATVGERRRRLESTLGHRGRALMEAHQMPGAKPNISLAAWSSRLDSSTRHPKIQSHSTSTHRGNDVHMLSVVCDVRCLPFFKVGRSTTPFMTLGSTASTGSLHQKSHRAARLPRHLLRRRSGLAKHILVPIDKTGCCVSLNSDAHFGGLKVPCIDDCFCVPVD